MRHRKSVTLGLASLAVAALVGTPLAAQADTGDPTCQVTLTVPTTIALDKANDPAGETFKYFVTRNESTPGCYTSQGSVDHLPFGQSVGGETDWSAGYRYLGNGEFEATDFLDGDYNTVQWGGQDGNEIDADPGWDIAGRPGWIALDSATMKVAGKGYITLSTKTKDHKTTLTATARHWTPSSETVEAWARAHVQVQEKTAKGWVTVKSAKASMTGKVTVALHGKKHSYRAIVAESDIAFGATSKVLKH